MSNVANIYDKCFDHVIKNEGGFVNDPLDKGGATNFGITKKVAREHGFSGKMQDLPLSLAKTIYKKSYWDTLRLDDVCLIDDNIASELFDSAVNCGTLTVGRWFQTAINLVNNNQKKFENLTVDGLIGQRTVAALRNVGQSDREAILKLLNILQGAHYINIATRDESQEHFILGWLKRVVV